MSTAANDTLRSHLQKLKIKQSRASRDSPLARPTRSAICEGVAGFQGKLQGYSQLSLPIDSTESGRDWFLRDTSRYGRKTRLRVTAVAHLLRHG